MDYALVVTDRQCGWCGGCELHRVAKSQMVHAESSKKARVVQSGCFLGNCGHVYSLWLRMCKASVYQAQIGNSSGAQYKIDWIVSLSVFKSQLYSHLLHHSASSCDPLVELVSVFDGQSVDFRIVQLLLVEPLAQLVGHEDRSAQLDEPGHMLHVEQLLGAPIVDPSEKGLVGGEIECEAETTSHLPLHEVSLDNDAFLVVGLGPPVRLLPIRPRHELIDQVKTHMLTLDIPSGFLAYVLRVKLAKLLHATDFHYLIYTSE